MTTAFSIQASEHPIKSVTVFKSSKAEITRTFKLELKNGQNKVEIKGLSSFIDTHSVRVSGLGAARLCDVVCTLSQSATAGYAPDSHTEVTRILKVKRQALETERGVREREYEMLLKYGQTLTGEHVNPGAMAQFLESYVSQSRKSLQACAELTEKILDIDRQIETENERNAKKLGTAVGKADVVIVSDEDAVVELKLTYIVSHASWTPTYELHAKTENGKPSPSVSLHYRARITQRTGEDWTNTALTLSTVTSDTLVRRIPQLRTVRIRPPPPTQLFGPKPGVNLFALKNNANQAVKFAPQANTFAFGPQSNQASSPSVGGLFGSARPQLFGREAQQLVPQQTGAAFAPPPQQVQAVPFGAFGGAAASLGTQAAGSGWNDLPVGAAAPPEVAVDTHLVSQYTAGLASAEAAPLPDDDDDLGFEDIATPSRAIDPTTIVVETPMAISFSVHGDSTIPSDGVDHQVSVAVLPFESKISYITIPRIDARVFLQCEVENTSEYRLLPGPVTVILDDSYVSKTSINDINTGDTFQCTLGDDASTKVTYERSAKTIKSSGGAYSEVTNTTTWTTKISIHNKHQFAITDLIVRDVVPTCEDKRAKIVLRKPTGLADAKDGQIVDLKNNGLKVGWEKLEDGKGGEKEGKFEWRWQVGNGAKVNLEAEWEVKAPGEDAWIESFN